MRVRKLGFWLCIGALVIASTGATLAQQDPPARVGEAEVKVSLDSSRLSVQGVDSVVLEITLQGRLACRQGAPPTSLAGTVLPDEEPGGLRLDLDPDSFVVDWKRSSNTGERETYEVNETLHLIATIVSPPQTRVVTDFIVLLQVDDPGDDRLQCSEEGYSIRQSDEPHDPLIVEPESASPAVEGRTFNWIPLLVGVALLGLVATLAVWREKLNER